MNEVKVAWGQTWPSLPEFVSLGSTHRVVPVVRRVLADHITPVGLYAALGKEQPGSFIMESAEPDGARGRWSFIGARSRCSLVVTGESAQWHGDVPEGLAHGKPLEILRSVLEQLKTEAIPGLPPLTGGMVGALGWDIVRLWEQTLPKKAPQDIDIPDVVLFLASDLAAIDHIDGSVWLIANAINANGTSDGIEDAYADALQRLDLMEADLVEARRQAISGLDEAQAEQTQIRYRSEPGEYERYVEFCQGAIRDGEAFQIVPSQRFEVDCHARPLDVYRVLRTVNPSPYMYYFQLEGDDGVPFAVVGSSPESLVSVKSGRVSTFPIAGSRPRGATIEEDRNLERELLADPKEMAEHIMLVDLARNDLVKVCYPTSVEVEQFAQVNRYSHIMHVCSTVVGELEPQYGPVDVLTATFPAGTLSGAPKPRAIALIDEIEPARRGFYGGAIGYFDFAGNLDLAIAIRTALIKEGTAYVQAGAGIVADSVPASEAEETRNKAAAMIRAVSLANGLQGR